MKGLFFFGLLAMTALLVGSPSHALVYAVLAVGFAVLDGSPSDPRE